MKYEHGRKLTVFNPTQSIAEGKSVIWTLNQTIIDTEKQINYYETQLQHSINFCNDYSNIYESLYICGTVYIYVVYGSSLTEGGGVKQGPDRGQGILI